MFPGPIHGYKTVVSTQDIARELALAGEPAGSVVMADFQTGGRGRQGRGWFAPPGSNVCMTVIGEPVPASEAWRIALVAGVAAAEGIREAVPTVCPSLRFPNDIHLEGLKVGGILVETVPYSERPGAVIPLIGIGVNVNVPDVVFPEELRARATSLLRVTGESQAVGVLSGWIVRRLCALWDKSFADTLLPLWRDLRDTAATRLFRLDGNVVICRVIDVTGDGTVTLETPDGSRREIPAALVILGED